MECNWPGACTFCRSIFAGRVESHSALQTGLLMSISGMSGIAMLMIVPQLAQMIRWPSGKKVMTLALFVQRLAMAWLGVTFVVALIDRRATLHSSRLIDSLFSRSLSTLGVAIDPGNAGRVAALVADRGCRVCRLRQRFVRSSRTSMG